MNPFADFPPEAKKFIVENARKGDPRCPIKIGSRVAKTQSEPGDHHKDGDTGTVIGSIFIPDKGPGYFVAFDGEDNFPEKYKGDATYAEYEAEGGDFFGVFIVGWRVKAL